MSLGLLVVIATALGGALILWNAISRTKHASDQMLDSYAEMLERARTQRLRELTAAAQREQQQDDAAADPR